MGKLIKFDHVNAQGDFSAMLTHYGLDYTRKGDQLRLLCLLHDDTKPSLNITLTATGAAQANTFHCFGCHESGSMIDFVAAMEGTTDLRAAAELIASVSGCGLAPPRTEKRAGKAKPRNAGKGSKSRSERSSQDSAKEDGSAPKNVPERDSAVDPGQSETNPVLKFALTLEPEHPYLSERVSPDTAKAFGLGYLPETSRSMMAGRVCIPIHNAGGELIAYAGRHTAQELPDDVPKYLLPKNFDKMAALFNLHRVDPAIRWVVIVEGFFGAMRLHELGVPVVATMGTAVSAAQIVLLEARKTKYVYLMFDGDDPGRAATPAALSLLARSFLVKVIDLPDDMEPDTVSTEIVPSGLMAQYRTASGAVVRTRLPS